MKSCRWMAIPCGMMFAMSLGAQGMGGGMQGGGTPSLTAGIVQQYNGVKTNLLAAADAMPEDGYSFIPANGERDFGGWVGHVAQAQLGTCSRLAGQTPDQPTITLLQGVAGGTKASKADLVAALKKSFDVCDAAYNGLTDANAGDPVPGRGNNSRIAALAGNTAHDNECYGSMAVYLRLKGIVPPSTAARGAMGGMRGGAVGGGMQGGAPPSGGER
jgi:DinB family protein